MRKRLISVIVMAALAFAVGRNCDRSENKLKMSELALANVEALAQGEEGGIAVKKCYTVFSSNYGDNYYATCSGYSNNGVLYECGAISSNEPAWGVTLVNDCYQSL